MPDFLLTIPDNADDGTKLYMRAQAVIQSAFYAFGDRELKPGTATLGAGEMMRPLAAAMALI